MLLFSSIQCTLRLFKGQAEQAFTVYAMLKVIFNSFLIRCRQNINIGIIYHDNKLLIYCGKLNYVTEYEFTIFQY